MKFIKNRCQTSLTIVGIYFVVSSLLKRKMKTLGVALIVIGIVMMIFTGFKYVTKKEVVNVGPVEINKTTEHPVEWSPIIGGILLSGGLLIVLTDKKRRV